MIMLTTEAALMKTLLKTRLFLLCTYTRLFLFMSINIVSKRPDNQSKHVYLGIVERDLLQHNYSVYQEGRGEAEESY